MKTQLGVCTLPSDLISLVACYHGEFTQEITAIVRRVQFPDQSQDYKPIVVHCMR